LHEAKTSSFTFYLEKLQEAGGFAFRRFSPDQADMFADVKWRAHIKP
jgi:hypothetical protein